MAGTAGAASKETIAEMSTPISSVEERGAEPGADLQTVSYATSPIYRSAYVAVSLAALAFGYALWALGHQPVVHDAFGYYTLAKLIGQNGLFGYSVAPDATAEIPTVLLRLRTYGYPAFLAVCALLSTFEVDPLHFVIFNVQLLLHICVCHWASQRIANLFRSQGIGLTTYILTAANPLLLIYTTEVLSDWLSAILAYVAVVLTLRPKLVSAANSERSVSFSFLSISLATITRSANVSVLFALGMLWIIRHKLFDRLALKVIPIVIAIVVMVDVPQLVNNYRAYGVIRPLVVSNYWSEDFDFAARNIKYITGIAPDQPEQWVYVNPFLPNGVTTAGGFARADGPGFVITTLLRAFALFDQDFPFPYVADFSPWYRWPLASVNFLLLGAAVIGIVAGLRYGGLSSNTNEIRFAFAAMFVSTAAYVAPHLLIHAENRYSLPVYLLLAPSMAYGLAVAQREVRVRRSWGWRTVVVLGTGGLVGGSVWLSRWLGTLRRPF